MNINPLMILLAAIFTHNFAFTYILGMCPLIAISSNLKTAFGMGISVIFVVVMTAMLNWPIYYLILIPTHSEIIAYIVFIITIAASVQLLEMIIEKFFPPLQAAFGIFLPLITVNCIVLAVSLFIILRNYNFLQTIFFALGSSIGWSLGIITIAAIREKLLLVGDIPKGLKGAGIVLVIAGIISLGFMGFAGMLKIQ
jgi:Na+-transporting NADH:ubiquinone oxidoreductase subunit E